MKVTVVDTLTEVELDDDVTAAARSLADDRKIMRLLDAKATLPFVAALTVLFRLPDVDPTDLALYFISGSDYRPAEATATDQSAEQIARSYYEHANPAGWLAGMPNSAICQTSVVGRIHGPNLHVVGSAPAAWHAACLAVRALDKGTAQVAMLVGYQPAEGDLDQGRASVLAFGHRADGVALDLEAPAGGWPASMTAVNLVSDWVDAARSASGMLAAAGDR